MIKEFKEFYRDCFEERFQKILLKKYLLTTYLDPRYKSFKFITDDNLKEVYLNVAQNLLKNEFNIL